MRLLSELNELIFVRYLEQCLLCSMCYMDVCKVKDRLPDPSFKLLSSLPLNVQKHFNRPVILKWDDYPFGLLWCWFFTRTINEAPR